MRNEPVLSRSPDMESTIVEFKKSASFSFSRDCFKAPIPAETVEKPMKQYLYFAFRRSIRDAESYDSAASGIPGDERHDFFKEMANRKREEADKLYSYYTADGCHTLKDMMKRCIISHPHYETLMQTTQIASIEDTYSFAFKREQNNLELYLKLAGLDDNPFTKILFDYLANLQTGHIAFIEKKFSLVDLRM
jgi:rubrerythrin